MVPTSERDSLPRVLAASSTFTFVFTSEPHSLSPILCTSASSRPGLPTLCPREHSSPTGGLDGFLFLFFYLLFPTSAAQPCSGSLTEPIWYPSARPEVGSLIQPTTCVLSIKLHWNTVKPICLHAVYGYFHTKRNRAEQLLRRPSGQKDFLPE